MSDLEPTVYHYVPLSVSMGGEPIGHGQVEVPDSRDEHGTLQVTFDQFRAAVANTLRDFADELERYTNDEQRTNNEDDQHTEDNEQQ